MNGVRRLESELDREFRNPLRVSSEINFQIVRRVEGDEPTWLLMLTDGLNERILARSSVVEGLKLETRKTFGARNGVRKFWEEFWKEDPIFCAKAAGEVDTDIEPSDFHTTFDEDGGENHGEFRFDDEEQTGGSTTLDKIVQILQELHMGDVKEAKRNLAELALELAVEEQVADKLLTDSFVGDLYEVSIQVKGE